MDSEAAILGCSDSQYSSHNGSARPNQLVPLRALSQFHPSIFTVSGSMRRRVAFSTASFHWEENIPGVLHDRLMQEQTTPSVVDLARKFSQSENHALQTLDVRNLAQRRSLQGRQYIFHH